ncbi:MAG: alpha-amylase family glycosyl hydrolase [Anaerolineae bacterium]|nr:alpha-amylase family glycosyl hydrolase [Anaerolineae bacterium]
MTWAKKPIIYQINTRVWLTELSQRFQRPITLRNLPDQVFDELADDQFDAVWLMGVWTRSTATRNSALNYLHEYRPVLPDLTEQDVIGSAYAIGAYEVDPFAGGRDGLAITRAKLAQRGIQLILDYVPNHVSTDHYWLRTHPEYFVSGSLSLIRKYGGMFFQTTDRYGRKYAAAHGRDPYFPSWIDTAQLNVFHPGCRQAIIDTLLDIASQCDGVRCDMAMLMMNHVFNRTWGHFIQESVPERDFWEEIIPAIRAQHPDFLFIAEAYWGLEYPLQQQGFNFTYDKTLYDRLFLDEPEKLLAHLRGGLAYQEQTIRFIENHDESRAAAAFGTAKSRVGALLILTLPGAVLLHDGQFVGRKVKLPVQINRQPDEPRDEALLAYYRELLREAKNPLYQQGQWQLLSTLDEQIIAYMWSYDGDYRLIVANLSAKPVEDTISLHRWSGELVDVFDARQRCPLGTDGTVKIRLGGHQTGIFRLESAPVAEYPRG